MPSRSLIPAERIERRILLIRGHRVILDEDLAELFGVTTKRLNEQVKRNAERFPEDFMFRLRNSETESLRSQIATSNGGRGGRRTRPYAFTEHGAIMAANVLNSPRAVRISVLVVRAFVRLRQVLTTHRELARKLEELENRIGTHDVAIRQLVSAIRELMEPEPVPEKREQPTAIGLQPSAIGATRVRAGGRGSPNNGKNRLRGAVGKT
jgi:phage regulator Rha-like protein